MQQIPHQFGATDVSPIIKITADHPVQFSLNNGITMLEFEPAELYSVSDFAARSMMARGWAKRATDDDLAAAPGKRRDGDDDGDEDDDDDKKKPEPPQPAEPGKEPQPADDPQQDQGEQRTLQAKRKGR